jgi:hypothetical protein
MYDLRALCVQTFLFFIRAVFQKPVIKNELLLTVDEFIRTLVDGLS